jgi:4-amino-4-deoxy-L-arabinose transferase-like glycosyltransferase
MPKIPFWVFLLIGCIYFIAIGVDTMDIDAAQYASMSREMTLSHNWLQIFDHGLDYLDKPPFLFWVSALSMKLFGVNNFAYKLPSILFALWALWATYRLGKLLYSEGAGRIAALILGTCQGMFLMTNDIRCDTILMSWVVTAVWLIKEWDVSGKAKHLYLGFAAAAFGMMTKGPIALLVPGFCFVADWVTRRQWKRFAQPQYLFGIVVIAVLLLPASIGLYQQFDLHPEKSVNGLTGVSGLRFFYWSQSFGRITGESPWKNGADISFLLLNMLWSFLPWIVVLLPALVASIVGLLRNGLRAQSEWLTAGGFLLTYLALGSSAYQLPHYIFVAFPLAAVLTAGGISNYWLAGEQRILYRIALPAVQTVAVLVLVLVLLLVVWVFPSGIFAVCIWLAGVAIWFWLAIRKQLSGKAVILPAVAMMIANILLSGFVYPALLHYQVGSKAGRYFQANGITGDNCIIYKRKDPMNAISFYGQSFYMLTDTIADVKPTGYLLTMDEGLADLTKYGFKYNIIKEGDFFKVSELTPDFLNPATRPRAVNKYYIVKMLGRLN